MYCEIKFIRNVSKRKSMEIWTFIYLFSTQRSGRHTAGPGSQLRKNHESFSMQADKKEKTRHNHFIKTAQPYKPKVYKFENKIECLRLEQPTAIPFYSSHCSYPLLVAWVFHRNEQKEQRRDCGHRRPRDTAVSIPFQWAACMGCANEEAENGTFLLAAWRGEHGKGIGGL